MTKQEEEKIREIIDNLLPIKELDTYLKNIACNVSSAPRFFLLLILLIVGTFVMGIL